MSLTGKDLIPLVVQAGVDPETASALDPAVPLNRQGLDSVDFPAFILALEEAHGTPIDDVQALVLRTLDDFAAYLNGRKG